MLGMDAPTAFLAALAITTAGGAVTTRTIRLRAKRSAADSQRDGEAYRHTHDRRRETYVEFSMTAGRIADAVALWADTPAAARPGVLDEARAHLQELRTLHAAAVVANSERLVDGLDLDADPAPELLTLALSERQSLPFLRACREYEEAESARYFGVAVRRAPRLSTR